MRLYVVAAIIIVMITVGGWLFWQGRQSGELDRTRDKLETRERQDDAARCDPDAHFLDRLRNC